MKVTDGAPRATAQEQAAVDLFELRCFLVLYPTGARSWPAAQEKLARFYARAQGGIVIEMTPKYPDAFEKAVSRLQAFAPTQPAPIGER